LLENPGTVLGSMEFRELFVVSDLADGERDSSGWGVSVKPSKRLQELHPHRAIAELQAHVDGLKDFLAQYQNTHQDEDLEKPENLAKERKAAFELDVSESYLAYLKKHYTTIH
jgi:hypothetical protein